jgi:hypothetical protein
MSREHVAGAPVISVETRQELTEKQLLDFRSNKRDMLRWLSAFDKNPDRGEGYSDTTIEQSGYEFGANLPRRNCSVNGSHTPQGRGGNCAREANDEQRA